ncbi:MAG: Trm112 family protein [Acidimicrobiales bacterium]|nr:Trm112 family protein [Acidimicrobiales bacterium]
MPLDETLQTLLACPDDKGPLYYVESQEILYNPRLRRIYRITDGIPNLLISEAETVDEKQNQSIMGEINSKSIKPTFEENS